MPSVEIYQARPIKKTRRTKAQVQQLEEQISEALDTFHPQSVRHVFYLMTNPRLPEPVAKTENGYNQVQNRCTLMRRNGSLPYSWFSDSTRYGYFTNTYQSASDFVFAMQSMYRADLWRSAEARCEVWVESRSIAGVLRAVCDECAVDLYPCGGFASLTFMHESIELTNSLDDNRPLHIFYFGDYDPAGVLIDKKVEEELRTHLRPDLEMHFHRLGINEDQIAEYDLPTKPRKAGDKRALHIRETVEAEAMPAHILQGIVRDAIEALMPPGALMAAKVAEVAERNHLIHMGHMLEGNT